MAKYLDSNGLSHLIGKIKTALAGKADTSQIPESYNSSPAMNGPASPGSSSRWSRGDHVHPVDTSRAASSHTHGNITNGGDITATAPTIESGDKLIINDESASKITNGPSFGTSTTTFLRNDGTWAAPADTTYSDFTGATSSAAGTHGLVPAPLAIDYQSILTGDGSWATIAEIINTATNSASGILEMYQDSLRVDATNTLMTPAQSTKLSGIEAGAEVNQNAFSNVKVGSTTVAADSKTDTLELVGSNVTLTPDATNDKVTIGITGTNVTTALGNTAVARATADASGNNIANTYAKLASPAFTGTPTAPTAAAGTNTTQIATTAFVQSALGDVAGALVYKGTVGTGGTVTDLPANHTKGWYYIVKAAGTFAGISCEAGDMIICHNTNTTASNSDWDVIQTNIETLTTTEIDALWTAA